MLAEDKLAKVKDALAVAEEAKHKAKAEAVRLEVERTSLLLEIGAAKNEVMELIFAYGYGCCVFKHNICGDQQEVPNAMPDSSDPLPLDFFTNSRFSPARAPIQVTTIEAEKSKIEKKAKEP